jgi:hypothetical protein
VIAERGNLQNFTFALEKAAKIGNSLQKLAFAIAASIF